LLIAVIGRINRIEVGWTGQFLALLIYFLELTHRRIALAMKRGKTLELV